MRLPALLLGFVLLNTVLVAASQSAEPVLVRVTAFDPATRVYTFTCTPPPGTEPMKYWTVRPDTPALEYSASTTSSTLTYNLSKDVLYHIGCQVINSSSGQAIRGDFHIDRRIAPNTVVPNVRVTAANNLNVSLHCDVPKGVTNYNLYWTLENIRETTPVPALNNMRDVNISIPYPLLWDIDCGVWNIDNQSWTQWGYPVEFMANGGQPYIPNVNGCIPGDPCPFNTTGTNTTQPPVNATNGTGQPPANATNSSCFTSLQNVPASCTGGAITADTFDGCRHLTCGAMSVLACDKPSSSAPQYFEMYKQSGGGATLCLGTTCISDGGYARSPSYPLCIGNATWGGGIANYTLSVSSSPSGALSINGTGFGATPRSLSLLPGSYLVSVSAAGFASNTTTITLAANTTLSLTLQPVSNATGNSTNTTACFSSVQSIPASCTGGAITQDTYNGCRTIACASGASSLSVLACDKQGFFEMYKQGKTGTAVSAICIGATCISDNGYAKSASFPICASAPGNGTNSSSGGGATVNAVSPFPADQAYVLSCDAQGLNATTWSWDFGDGTHETRSGTRTYSAGNPYGPSSVPNKDVYHAFPSSGSYQVSCTASDGVRSAAGSRTVSVAFQAATSVSAQGTGGLSYALTCDPATYSLTQYYSGTIWNIRNATGDTVFSDAPGGEGSLGLNFSFPSPGQYSVECRPRTSDDRFRPDYWKGDAAGYTPCNSPGGCVDTTSPTLPVTVPPASGASASLGIAPWFPQGRSYVFVCNATGFTPSAYDFAFGDGNKQLSSTQDNVYYTYGAAGSYQAACTARNGAVSASGQLSVTVA